MSTHNTFKKKNTPNVKIENAKKWIKENPHLARRKVEEVDYFNIEVFGYNHKEVSDDLYKALKKSGFLDKHPLFKIKIEPM